MEIVILLAVVTSLISTLIRSCSISPVDHGRLLHNSEEGIISPGVRVEVLCDVGYVSHDPNALCNEDGEWEALPTCSKVCVKFFGLSMIRYTYPVPFDSMNGSISFSFSTQADKSSGVLVRLSSQKMRDSDSITVELVEGYLAVTMQLRSRSQNIVAYCHNDVLLNDNLVHSVALTRDNSSLALFVDNKLISCNYPSGRHFIFSSLRNVQVGHLSPSWDSHYGFKGCITDLLVQGLDLLVLAYSASSSDTSSEVGADNLHFTSSCGTLYKSPTEPPANILITPTPVLIIEPTPLNPSLVADSLPAVATVVLVSCAVLLVIALVLCGVLGCRALSHTKGSYLVDEGRLTVDGGEQEYYL